MTRLRIDYEGAWHHVMNRGARREPIFTSARDARTFLGQIGAQIERTGIEVHAYCLMGNHFHLLVRSPDRQLSEFMQHLLSRYTRIFNQRRGFDGPLFRGRFLSKLVGSDAYLSAVGRYIMRNPIDVRPPVALDRYRWSSYGAYLGLTARPDWLTTDFLWGFHGSCGETFRGHVEGGPITVGPSELRSIVSMALAERHPDPTIDTLRFDRMLTTAIADRLPEDRATELLTDLGYPSATALRSARWRARRQLDAVPAYQEVIEHVLSIVA